MVEEKQWMSLRSGRRRRKRNLQEIKRVTKKKERWKGYYKRLTEKWEIIIV